MSCFSDAREAKEFLIERIVDEARRKNVPLSEIERKMLYFTESGWTLPDIEEVAEKFDEEYNRSEYECKITRLAEHALRRARDEAQFDQWRDAVRVLEKEDHYLSLMLCWAAAAVRPPHDRLKLWVTAFAIVAAFISISVLADRYHIDLHKYMPSRSDFELYFWIGLMALFVLFVLGNALGGLRFTSFIDSAVEKLAGLRRKMDR